MYKVYLSPSTQDKSFGVGDFGVTENILYISRESTQKMKSTVLDGDDWDF